MGCSQYVCFDGARINNYIGGEPVGSTEMKLEVKRVKNGRTTGKDKVTGEMIKSVVEIVLIG